MRSTYLSMAGRIARRILLVSLGVVTALGLVSAPSIAASGDEESTSDVRIFIGDIEYVPGSENSDTGVLASSCSSGDSNQRIIYSYERNRPASGSGLPSGVSRMRCGSSSWGLRHVDLRHSSQWETIAARVGGQWEDFMSWAVRQILYAPESATYRSQNDTWSYTAPLEIRDNQGNVVGRYRPLVSIAAGSGNVITTYPRSA